MFQRDRSIEQGLLDRDFAEVPMHSERGPPYIEERLNQARSNRGGDAKMTDAPIETATETAEVAPPTRNHDALERDWFLIQLVSQVNDLRIGISITLNVGGTIISGSLVSGAEYFEGFAKEMAGSFADKDVAEGIRNSYAQLAEIYPKKVFDDKGEQIGGEKQSNPPSYIHLADARFFANGQPSIPSNKGVWWRGRIAAVDGFSLGSLSSS